MSFDEILLSCGMRTNDSSGDSVSCDDSYKALRMLESELRRQAVNMCDICRGLVEFLSSPRTLHQALVPMTTDTARPTDRYVPNDSLLKVLLRVRPLQRDLLGFLLEQVLNASTDPSIRASIVLHLKACDVVYDPSAFTASVLEILPALDRQIQMDFIALFPSFALARDYERIVGDLMDLTHADTELVSSVLEAVSNLSLAPTSRALAASVERALELLSSCSPCQLPPVVRFLLDTAHAEVAERVLEQLRCAVSEFVALALSERGEDRKACLSAEALLLGILKISFYSKSLLFTVFYKHFSGDSAPDVTTFDLWVMYCLGSCKKLKARLHTLICRLMSTGKIGHEHVSASLARSGYPLEDTLPSMLELAQNTLGSTRLGAPGASLQLFGRLLYRELYKEFKSGSSRQEVVAALVAHAGSPCTTEVNAALSVLRDLCEWEADQPPSKAEATLRSFLPFLKSLLDDITRFTPEQNRTVFTVIFRCRRTGKEPTQDYDDIMIMLRKLCVSTDLQRRKVSVIGVIIYLSLSLEEDWTGSSEHHRTFHHVVRQTREDPGTRVALLDEIFQSLQACAASNTTVCQSLGDAIADLCIHTLHSFVLEQSPSTESLSNRDPRLLQCDKRLSLREDCCRTVYLYSGCIESTKVTRAVPPIDTLAPAVRVLSALALLRPDLAHTVLDLTVLPLELPSEDSLDRSEDFTQSTRDNLCYSLRYAVDWTRECVNAMCRHVSNDSSSASKLDLLARINHMIDLESVLLNQSQRNGKFCDAMFPFAMGSTKAVRARKGKAEKDNTLQSAKHAAPKDEVDAKGLEVLFAAVLRKSDYANTLALRYVTRADEGSLCKTPFHLLTRRAILRLVGQIADASARNFEGDAHAVKSLFADSSFSALRDILEWVSGTLGEERIMTDCDPEDCYAFIVASAALVSSVLGCKGTRNEALQYCTQVKAGAWSELPLVFTVLLSLSGGASDSLDDKSAVSLLEDVSFSVFEYFAALVPKLTDVEALECVVSCVKLLDDLLGIIAQLPRDAHNDIIADLFPQKGSELSLLCDDILRRNWKDSINKRKYSVKDIFVLVKISVKWALKPYQRIQILVDDVLMELKDTDNWLGPAENYPTLTAASFVLYFSAIFQSIGEQWMLTIEAYNGGELEPEESLRRLKSLANSFTGLVHLTRMHEELEKKSVLITALREGRKFVEAFLNQTNLKIVSGLFDDYQDSILAIIKNVQKATRQLQSILSHGKLSRDRTLSAEAPAIRKALEELIFKIKALLSSKGSNLGAKVGELKHRKMDGTLFEDDRYEEEEAVEEPVPKPVKKRAKILPMQAKKRRAVIADDENAEDATERVDEGEDVRDRSDAEEEEEDEENNAIGSDNFLQLEDDDDEDEEEVSGSCVAEAARVRATNDPLFCDSRMLTDLSKIDAADDDEHELGVEASSSMQFVLSDKENTLVNKRRTTYSIAAKKNQNSYKTGLIIEESQT